MPDAGGGESLVAAGMLGVLSAVAGYVTLESMQQQQSCLDCLGLPSMPRPSGRGGSQTEEGKSEV